MNSIAAKINALTRPNIRALQPYSSARDEAPPSAGARRIMLDANENSLGGPLDQDYSRYPDPHQTALKQAIAVWKGLSPDQIFVGNGSDEAIDLLLRAFVEPGLDNIVLMPPTYGMYAVQANIQQVDIRKAPLLPNFSPDPQKVRLLTDSHSKLLFLCSPNNPSGQCLPETFVLQMLAEFPGLVVLDEAYVDFSSQASWTTRLPEFPNLVILQTLSKAWGLAGLRIGMAYSNSEVIGVLNKIKYPYNLNAVTMERALEALTRPERVAANIQQLLQERQRLAKALLEWSGVEEVFPSEANFLLVRVKDPDGLYRYLAENGIIVRNRDKELHCARCLRITVGAPEENEQLLRVLHRFDTQGN